eukprot:3194390-Prymnesium_polylepis.1
MEIVDQNKTLHQWIELDERSPKMWFLIAVRNGNAVSAAPEVARAQNTCCTPVRIPVRYSVVRALSGRLAHGT